MAAAAVLTAGLALSACGGASTSSASSSATSGAASARRAPGGSGSTSGAGGTGSAAGAGQAVAGGGSTQLGTTVSAPAADIVRTGTITVRVARAALVARVFGRLRTLAAAEGGFVASSDLRTGRQPTATATLRVPASREPDTTGTVEGLGVVTGARFGGQDVTGQVVDLGAELANLRSEEAAVRKLLAAAPTVKDILTIQQQLFSLQGEIQTLQAQQNSLDNQVAYATLTVDLVAPPASGAPARHHHRSTLQRFATLASSHTVDVVRGAVLAVGWSAPLLVVAALVGGAFAILRRRRRQHAPPEPAASRP